MTRRFNVLASLSIASLMSLATLAVAGDATPATDSGVAAPAPDAALLPPPPEMPKGVADVAVEDVERLLTERKGLVFDVNGASTREKNGSVPGATLLGSSSDYPSTALPADKATTLVFYCANPRCMASHGAAKRAVSLGYTDVRVMSAGIAGWKQSGRTTLQPKG